MDMDKPRPIEILLIESQPRFIEAARQAFSGARMKNTLRVIENGNEALNFLARRGKHRKAPRPDVIILDPSVNGPNGWTLLSEIKTDPDLMDIPVVVQTASESEMKLLKAYNLHDLFIVKPFSCDEFLNVVRAIPGFGMVLVRQDTPADASKGAFHGT